MFQLTFIFLGVVAIAASAGAMARGFDDGTRIILGGLAMVCWAVWGFSAFSVEVATQGGIVTHSYRSLAYLGFGASVVMTIALYPRVFEQLNNITFR